MSDGLDYANEKFACVVYDMARSDDSLRQRLYDAYMCFHPVGLFDLPEPLQAQLTAITTRLNAVPAVGDEGCLRRTLSSISDQEVRRIAQLIVDLACEIESEVRHRESDEHYRTLRVIDALLDGPRLDDFDELGVSPCEQERSG